MNIVEDFKRNHDELRRLYDSASSEPERLAILRAMDDLGKVFNQAVSVQPVSIPVTAEEAKAFRAEQEARLTPREKFDRGNSRRQAIQDQRARRV